MTNMYSSLHLKDDHSALPMNRPLDSFTYLAFRVREPWLVVHFDNTEHERIVCICRQIFSHSHKNKLSPAV